MSMPLPELIPDPASESTEREGLAPPRSRLSEVWYGFSRSKIAVVSLAFIVLVVVVAIIAPLLQSSDPFSGGKDALTPPLTPGHLLGTDNLGRDTWSQLVNGSRVSLMVGFTVAAAATVIGILVGALAGFFGGWLDSVLMRITEFFQTLPRLVLALIIVALFGSSITILIGVIAILSWPQTARVVRAGFQTLRSAGFVDAARVSGMPRSAIIFREILPNVIASVVVIASLDVGVAILTEASLSFFGLGDPNLVSWGGMLQQAQQYLAQAWWMAVFPGVAIALVVLAFNVLGDGLNDALNPRLKERG
jgi:peptide/nickel transport system permease protein